MRRKHPKILRELPPEVVEAVNSLIIAGHTYQEIVDFLKSKGHEISRASVGRYSKDFLPRLERLKVVKEQARAIIENNADAPATEMAEAANQLAMQLIMEHLMTLPDLEGEKATEVLKALARLEQSSVARERLKLEYRAKAESVVSGLRDEELSGKSPEEIREIISRRIREEYGG